MKHVLAWLRASWKQLVLGGLVVLFAYLVLLHTIVQPQFGFSATEMSTYLSTQSWHTIWLAPVDAPFRAIVTAVSSVTGHSPLVARYVAAAFAALTAGMFYSIVVHLFSRRIAVLATLMYIFTTGFLHTAHVGAPLIMQLFGVLAIMAFVPYYTRSSRQVAPFYIGAILFSLLLYTPGMVWMIAAGGVVMGKRIVRALRQLAMRHKVSLFVISALSLTPFVAGLIRQPSLALRYLGLPARLPSLVDIGHQASQFVTSLVWRGTGPPDIMLVGAPILNVIELGLIATGIVLLVRTFRLKSNLFIAGGLLMFSLLVIGGGMSYVVLTPIFGLLLANGLYYLLNEWFDVFPLNVVANIIGTAALFAIVSMSVLFHVRAYYIGWPHSSATHRAFSNYPSDTVPPPAKRASSVHF